MPQLYALLSVFYPSSNNSIDTPGAFLLVLITLFLLVGATIYFVRHKRVTSPHVKESEGGKGS